MSNPLWDAGRMKKRTAHLPVKPGCGNPHSSQMRPAKAPEAHPKNPSKMAKPVEIRFVTR
jgi:hypothetical protein